MCPIQFLFGIISPRNSNCIYFSIFTHFNVINCISNHKRVCTFYLKRFQSCIAIALLGLGIKLSAVIIIEKNFSILLYSKPPFKPLRDLFVAIPRFQPSWYNFSNTSLIFSKIGSNWVPFKSFLICYCRCYLLLRHVFLCGQGVNSF